MLSPTSGTGIAYTPDGGSLASFNGLNPNGTWRLFFADRSAGDLSAVSSWSLDITAVREPVNVPHEANLTNSLNYAATLPFPKRPTPARAIRHHPHDTLSAV